MVFLMWTQILLLEGLILLVLIEFLFIAVTDCMGIYELISYQYTTKAIDCCDVDLKIMHALLGPL